MGGRRGRSQSAPLTRRMEPLLERGAGDRQRAVLAARKRYSRSVERFAARVFRQWIVSQSVARLPASGYNERMPKTKVIATRATPAFADLFVAVCKKSGVEPSTILRTLLEDMLVAKGYELPIDPKVAKAKAVIANPAKGKAKAPKEENELAREEREKAEQAMLSPAAKKRFAEVRAGRKIRGGRKS